MTLSPPPTLNYTTVDDIDFKATISKLILRGHYAFIYLRRDRLAFYE